MFVYALLYPRREAIKHIKEEMQVCGERGVGNAGEKKTFHEPDGNGIERFGFKFNIKVLK